MSLNYNLSEIKDYERLCFTGDGQINPVTQALIFHQLQLATGGVITDKNVEEVFKRIWIQERCFGPMLTSTYLRYEDVVAHIGLKTNAFGNDGKRAFKDNVMKGLFRDADRELQRQMEEMKPTVKVMEESCTQGK